MPLDSVQNPVEDANPLETLAESSELGATERDMAGGAEVEAAPAGFLEEIRDRSSGEDCSKGGEFTEKDATFTEKKQSEGLQGAADVGGGKQENVDEGGAVREEETEKKDGCVVFSETVDVCVQSMEEIASTSLKESGDELPVAVVVASEDVVNIEVVKSHDGGGDVEKGTDFSMKEDSRVDEGIGSDSVDVKFQATGGPCENEGEVDGEPSATEAGMGRDSCTRAAEPQVGGQGSETHDESMMDHDCDEEEVAKGSTIGEGEVGWQLSLDICRDAEPPVAGEGTVIRDGSTIDHDCVVDTDGQVEATQGLSQKQREVATESTEADRGRHFSLEHDCEVDTDGQVEATQGPSQNQKEVATESTEADISQHLSLEISRDADPQEEGEETCIQYGSMIDHDCDGGHETSVNEQVLATEGPSENQGAAASESTAVEAGIGRHLSWEISFEADPQVAGEETGIQDGPMMDHDCDEEREALVDGQVEATQGPSQNQGEAVLESTAIEADIGQHLSSGISRDADPQAVEEIGIRDGPMMDHDFNGEHETSIDMQVEAMQGHGRKQGEAAIESPAVEANVDQHLSLEISRDADSQVAGEEIEVQDGVMMVDDCGEVREASNSDRGVFFAEMESHANLNSQEGGITVLDSVSVDDRTKLKEDGVGKGSHLGDPVEEEHPHIESVATELDDKEEEASHLPVSTMDIHQNICDNVVMGSVPIDGSEVDERDVHCLENSSSMSDEGTGHDSVCGDPTSEETDKNKENAPAELQAAGEETEIQDGSVMDHDCEKDAEASNSNHGVSITELGSESQEGEITVLDSVSVDNSTKLQVEDVGNGSNLRDPVEEEHPCVAIVATELNDQGDSKLLDTSIEIRQNVSENAVLGSVSMKCGIVEKDVPCLEEGSSKVDEGSEHDSLDGDRATERPDNIGEVSAEPQMAGEESETKDGFLMDHDCEEEQEASNSNNGASVAEMEVEANQNSLEGETRVSDSVSPDDSIKRQEEDVGKGSSLSEPDDKEHPQLASVATELDDASDKCKVQEALVLPVTSGNIHQNISDNAALASVSMDECGVEKKNVHCLEEGCSKVSEGSGHDLIHEHADIERSGYKGDVCLEPQEADEESEIEDESMMDQDCEDDQEASNSNPGVSIAGIELGTNQNREEEGIKVLDSVSIDDSTKLQDDNVAKGSGHSDPAEEEHPQLASVATELDDRDEEASILPVKSRDVQHSICDNVVLGSVSMDECGVVEKDVPQLEEGISKVEKVTGCDSLDGDEATERSDNKVEVCAEPQTVGEETEIRDEFMMEHDCEKDRGTSNLENGVLIAEMESGAKHNSEGEISVLDPGSIDDSIKLKEDDVDKNSNHGDLVEEEHPQVASLATELDDKDQEADNAVLDSVSNWSEVVVKDVARLEEGSCKVNEGTGLDSLDGDQETERSDNRGEVFAEPQAAGEESEIKDRSLMDHDCEEDRKASDSNRGVSIAEMESDTEGNRQDGGIRGLDSVSVDNSTKLQEGDTEKGPNHGDPVEKEHPQVVCRATELDDGFDKCNDQEAPTFPVSSIDIHQNIFNNEDVPHLEEGRSKVEGGAGYDSVDGVRAAERSDYRGEALEEPQAAGEEHERRYESTVVYDCDSDLKSYSSNHDVSVAEMEVDATDSANDSIKLQEDELEKASNPSDFVEEHPQVACVVTVVDDDSDRFDQNQGEVVAEPQVVSDGTEFRGGSIIDHDCDQGLLASCSDQKDFTAEMTSEINQNSKEGGSIVVNSVAVHDSEKLQECPQVVSVAAEADGGPNACEDQEASILPVSLVDTDQKLGLTLADEEEKIMLDSDPVPAKFEVADTEKAQSLADPVVKIQTEVPDGSLLVDNEVENLKTSDATTSFVELSQIVREAQETVLVSVPVDDTTTEQADHVKENSELSQIAGDEIVMADNFPLDADKQKGSECSVSLRSLVDDQVAVAKASISQTLANDEDILEQGSALSASFPLDGPVYQADHVEKITEVADEVIDEHLADSHRETGVIDESITDTDQERVQEVFSSQMPSVGDNGTFQQKDLSLSDSVPVDKRLCHDADHITEETELLTPLEDGNSDFSKITVEGDIHVDEEVKVVTESVSVNDTASFPVDNTINDLIVTDAIEAHAEVMNKEVNENIEFDSVCCDDNVSHQIDSVLDQSKVDHVSEVPNSISAELDESISIPVINAETRDSKDFVRDDVCLAETVLELEALSSDANPSSENNPMEREDIMASESHRYEVIQGVDESQNANAHRESTIFEEDTSSLGPQCQETGLIEELEVKQEYLGPADSNVFIVESNNDEQKVQVVEEELLRETEKQAIEPPVESDQVVRYYLPPVDKTSFSMSDLVWGKVKSHPWWPGQIFDPSDSSKLAMKYQKKDGFLIAYFGDKTFAWCEESQLKPFLAHFSQLEKQCSSDTFVKAIHDILAEVTRRVELGMACSCLPEESCANIKYQKVENAGIRGGDIDSIIDRPTVLDYFQPDRLLQYVVDLAQSPNGRVDKLEFVMARSQLKSYYRSKGYPELPLFIAGGGLMEIVPENSPSVDKRSAGDIIEYLTPLSELISAKCKSKIGENSIKKREHGSIDSGKQKCMPKSKTAGADLHPANSVKVKPSVKVSEKSILNSSGKKHIVVESDPVASGRCKKKMLDPFGHMEPRLPSPTVASSFKIGEFIRRAASQLTGAPPPIIKCQGEIFQKGAADAEQKRDVASDFDIVPGSPVEKRRTILSFTEDFKPTDEMLSQLHLAAKDPMMTHSFVSPVVSFFTGFRSSCVSPSSEDEEKIEKQEDVQKHDHVEKRKRGRPRKVITQQASSDHNSAEDDDQVEKRKKGMHKRVIPQLASSEISSSEETKHSEKRKRRRPRKFSPHPGSSDSSSSEDKLPVQKRGRGRPKKASLASLDCNSTENKKKVENFEHSAHCEKRKRGRPKKVHSQIVPSDFSSPDHMKDSCCSDVNEQIKRKRKGHTQNKNKRTKSSGESSFSPTMDPMEQHIEQHLQLVAVNPNLKHTFAGERSIISVEEKIVDERMPTALVLSFNNANSLPSETDLIRIFSRYGPLKEAETDIMRKSNRAKVVFKRRIDAERAFSSAGKYSIFGPGLLSYQLRPWTPKFTPQAIPQVILDEPFIATLQETPDAEPTTALQGAHDAAPSSEAQGTHDAAPIITVQNRSDTGSAAWSNLGHLEQEEVVIAPDTIQSEAECMKSSLQDEHDLLSVTTLQETHAATAEIGVQDKSDISPADGSNLRHLEQAEVLRAPNSAQIEAEGEESSLKDMHGPLASPPEKHKPAPTATPQGNLDEELISMQQDSHDAAPMVLQQEKYDTATRRDDKLEVSEQVGTQMASGTMHVEDDPGVVQVLGQAETRVALDVLQVETELGSTETSDRLMEVETEGRESSG